MSFCKGLVKTNGLLIVRGTFLCASFLHTKWVIELYRLLLWLVELLVEFWGAMMEQTPVRCAVTDWDTSVTGSLYYTCSLTQVYWPLLEQEWTRPSARMFSLHADVVKGEQPLLLHSLSPPLLPDTRCTSQPRCFTQILSTYKVDLFAVL